MGNCLSIVILLCSAALWYRKERDGMRFGNKIKAIFSSKYTVSVRRKSIRKTSRQTSSLTGLQRGGKKELHVISKADYRKVELIQRIQTLHPKTKNVD